MFKNTGKSCCEAFLSACLHTQNVYHIADRQKDRPVPRCVLSGPRHWLKSELSARSHFSLNGCSAGHQCPLLNQPLDMLRLSTNCWAFFKVWIKFHIGQLKPLLLLLQQILLILPVCKTELTDKLCGCFAPSFLPIFSCINDMLHVNSIFF